MKEVLKSFLNFFLSLRTGVLLLLAMLVLLVFGAVQMPAMHEYGDMNSLPLFEWLVKSPFRATWWLWGTIGLLSLLTANTLLCSVESLIKKRKGRQWLFIISPQVIHIGFLFILFAHLMSSSGGQRWNAVAGEGMRLSLPNQTVLQVKRIDLSISRSGFPVDWRADIAYYGRKGRKLMDDFLAPNRPSFHRGLGVYIKEARPGAVLLEVSREPGAPWALAGGVLFTLGTVALSALKVRRER